MHVIYFHQYFSTQNGSTGLRSYQFAKHLVESGHQVTMVCGSYAPANTGLTTPFVRGRREGKVAGIQVIEFEIAFSNHDNFLKRVTSFLLYSLRSTMVALRLRADICFATSTPLTAVLPALFARYILGRPYVFEIRDLWPELPVAMGIIRNPALIYILGVFEKLAYRSSRHCIALAPGILDSVASHVGQDRVTLIPNGCDLALRDTGVENGWRPDTIPDDAFLAVYAGTHGQANGLGAILDAAAELKRRGRQDIALLLVGDGKEKKGLQHRAKQERIDNVQFLSYLPKHRLAGLLCSADVGLQTLADLSEFYDSTSPNKFFDYLSLGLPVVINYPGWITELALRSQCGITVRPNAPAEFADALCLLADNPKQRQTMAHNARALAEAEFDRSLLALRFSRVLARAVDC